MTSPSMLRRLFSLPSLAALLLATALLSPGVGAAQNAPAAQARSAAAVPRSYKDLRFPPLPPLRLPKVDEFTLPNGLKVMMVEDHRLPIINGFALIHTGNLLDPKDKIGLAGITGEVLREGGAVDKPAAQLNDELEKIAASIETGIGETSGSAGFFTLKENLPLVLGDFADLLQHPAFPQDKLDLAKVEAKGEISRRNDSASGQASDQFHDLLYGKDTPYGWETEYDTIDAIQRGDLVDLYQRFFKPDNMTLSVVGDFDPAAMRALITKDFASWSGQAQPAHFVPVHEVPRPGLYLIDRDDVNQTNIRIGQFGGELKDPDYPALAVMSEILGGGFSSRLFKQVRTNLGLAYGVGASWGADFDHPGLFTISSSTKSATTVQAIQEILKQVELIRQAPVTAQELKTAKDAVLNSFVFNFDTPAKTVERLATYRYYGYPDNFIFRYRDAVERVTAQDVLRVARTYLHPEQFAILVDGDAKAFGTPLSALKMPVTPVDVTIPPPHAAAQAAAATPASRAAAQVLLQRAVTAMGGAALLSAKDMDVTEVGQQVSPPIQMNVHSQTIFSGGLCSEMQVTNGATVTMFLGQDAASSWLASPQGTMQMPPPMWRALRQQSFQCVYCLLQRASAPQTDLILAAAGPAQRGGHAVDLLTISDPAGNATTLGVRRAGDPLAGLVVSLDYSVTSPQGTAHLQRIFNGYHASGGIQVPAAVHETKDGKPYSDITVRSRTFNVGLSETQLSAKPQ